MPAIRDLYPKYCAACDNIEGRFKELAELVRRMQKDGIHQGYIYDELFDAIIEKRSEITRCKYCDNDYYSQFLYYDKRVCDALQDRPWENEEFADCNIVLNCKTFTQNKSIISLKSTSMKSMENKTLEELDNLENDYIARHWDTRGRHESDMELNDIARAKIAAVKRDHGICFLAKFNPANTESIFVPYDGRLIYNFEYDIAVPVEDEELRRLLILLNDRQAQNYSSIMERIFNRASEIGGVVLMWV